MSNTVPDGWSVAKVGDAIASADGGVSVNSENRLKTHREFGILKTSAVFDGCFFPSEHKTILPDEVQRATTSPKKNHILFSRMNTPVLVGQSGYVDKDYSDLFLPDRLWQIKVKEEYCAKWLSYTLRSQGVVKKISDAATGTSNSMKNIAKPNLMAISILHPPLPEQQKIAAILSSVDDVIEKTQAQIDKLKDLKAGMMQELLSPTEGSGQSKAMGYTEFKDSPVGRIPVGWDVVQFRDIFEEYKYGPRFSSKDYDADGNVKTIRGTDVSTNGEIHYQQVPVANIDDKTVSAHTLKEGDLVMITTADCGVSAVFRDQGFPYIASAYAIKLTPKDSLVPEFIKFFMQTSFALRQVESFVRKGTVANLPGSDVMTIKLGLPQRLEQEKIASVLNSLDKKIGLMTEKHRALANTKKALMQDLLTGKVRVQPD